MNKTINKIEELGEFTIECCVKSIDGDWEVRYIWECSGAIPSCPWEGYKTFKEALKSLSEVKYR